MEKSAAVKQLIWFVQDIIPPPQQNQEEGGILHRLEMGEQNVTLKTLEHLSARFRCKVSELLGGMFERLVGLVERARIGGRAGDIMRTEPIPDAFVS